MNIDLIQPHLVSALFIAAQRTQRQDVAPFGQPVQIACLGSDGRVGRWRTRLEALRSNRHYASWLKGMGVDTDQLDPAHADRIISAMRADSRAAEEYFTGLLDRGVPRLSAPVISVVIPVIALALTRIPSREMLVTVVASVFVGHTAWHWLVERWQVLAKVEWPQPDPVRLALWLVLAAALGGVAWGLLGRSSILRRRDAQARMEPD